MADSKNIRLINEVPVDCSAYADENSINIVLRNLIMNAIKFTGSGGTVRVKSHVTGPYVKVMVEDNGIGIPVNKQELLFGESYYTSPGTNKETGSGLGLLICKDLIQKNGGSLQFTSEPGSGTTFSFSLPVKTDLLFDFQARYRVGHCDTADPLAGDKHYKQQQGRYRQNTNIETLLIDV